MHVIRRLLATIALVSLAAAPSAVAAAQPAAPGSVRFVGAPGTTFTIPGLGRFVGTVEVVNAPGGLRVINQLTMDAYVEGLGEMPADWPMEALKAQVVAARSYAWYSIELGTFASRGYDICATVACQVFSGREVVESVPNGHRWAQAVAETSGEVLTWDGEPLMARFFSSSGGHTRDNELVFGYGTVTAGPKPYLQGVEDPDDAIAPHHRWQISMTRAELESLLVRGASLSEAVPLHSLEWIAGDGRPDGTRVDQVLATRSTDGHQVMLSASKFRAWLSEIGPQVLPHRFPARTPDGRPLPDVVPSSRFEFDLTMTDATITGKGWGHGVGMGQWGARGKAQRGMGYSDILAAYYNGARPTSDPAMPDRVRVGLTDASGPFSISADGPAVLVSGAQGAEIVPGAALSVRPGPQAPVVEGQPFAWSPDLVPRDPQPAPGPAPDGDPAAHTGDGADVRGDSDDASAEGTPEGGGSPPEDVESDRGLLRTAFGLAVRFSNPLRAVLGG